MTLCVVWRRSTDSIAMATDSRVSFGKSCADVSPKLSTIRVRLSPATPSGGTSSVSHDFLIGLSVVGSAVSTLMTKELLQPILGALQYTSTSTADISLRSIADVIGRVFQRISRAVCSAIFEGGLGELLLVGRCPRTQEAKALRIGLKLADSTIEHEVCELLLTSDAEFFGSGGSAATSLYRTNPSWQGFKIVHEVSVREMERGVGGSVQFGMLQGADFVLKGVRGYQVHEERREYTTRYCIAGMEVYGESDLLAGTEFIATNPFLDVFAEEIQQLDADGYSFVPSTDHW